MAGDDSSVGADVIPDRRDFARAFRVVAREINEGRDTLTAGTAVWLSGENMNYVKFRIILAVFAERGIFGVEEPMRDSFRVTALPTDGKVDLEGSPLLRRLRACAVAREDHHKDNTRNE